MVPIGYMKTHKQTKFQKGPKLYICVIAQSHILISMKIIFKVVHCLDDFRVNVSKMCPCNVCVAPLSVGYISSLREHVSLREHACMSSRG